MGLTSKLVTILLFLCFSAETVLGSQNIKTFETQYNWFNESNKEKLAIEEPAAINYDALQVTPDTAGAAFALYNRSGRVLLDQTFKLWDNEEVQSNSTRVASFNSSFLINLYRLDNNSATGEGLAFVIVPDKATPPRSDGEYMGLTNSTTDGNSTNHLIAVEFDTFEQDFDPDNNHIGLNINSVRSNKTVSLTPLGIELVPKGAKFYNVWVHYDGVAKNIEVYIVEQAEKDGPTPARPASPVLKSNLDLRDVVAQNSYFGFAASTGNTIQLNCVLRWNLTVHYHADDKHPWLKIVLGAGVPGVLLLVIGMLGLGYYYFYRKRLAGSDSNILGALKSLPGMPREFQFKELKKATNNFNEKNKLGQGGYGVVYRGLLPGENLEVAVKCFSRESIKGEDDFLAELTIINRLRHRHLVRLLGWCHKNGKLLLVYEYMPNGSLDKHLFGDNANDVVPLSWNLRYRIISGLASALHYLHNEYDQKVVHRDLKASNIMLDSNFNAKLGDFGLARALDHEKNSYTEAAGVLGTAGYIAPECFHTAKATQQSDVYAFGGVLLEVVSGLRPGTKIGAFPYLVDWVWCLHREGRLLEAVDERLAEDYVAEEAERVLLLGLACCHPIASERLDTKEIIQIVSGSGSVPYVPPFKPSFVWPAVAGLELGLGLGGEDISGATTLDTTTTSHFGSGWSPLLLSRESYVTYTSDNSLV